MLPPYWNLPRWRTRKSSTNLIELCSRFIANSVIGERTAPVIVSFEALEGSGRLKLKLPALFLLQFAMMVKLVTYNNHVCLAKMPFTIRKRDSVGLERCLVGKRRFQDKLYFHWESENKTWTSTKLPLVPATVQTCWALCIQIREIDQPIIDWGAPNVDVSWEQTTSGAFCSWQRAASSSG